MAAPSPTTTPTSRARCSPAASSSCPSCRGSPTPGRRSPSSPAASRSSSGSSSACSPCARRCCGSGRRGGTTRRFRARGGRRRARRARSSTAASPGASPAAACSRAATNRTTWCWRRACGATTTSRSRTTTPAATRCEYYRAAAPAALPRARPRRRDLLDPPGRPRARRGADLCRGRLLRRRGLPRLLRRRRGRRAVARGAAAHGLGARGDPGVGRRRRQRAVRLQQHHRLSRDPGRGVRHGRLPDRHAARRHRPAPRPRRGRAARVLALLPWLSSKYALMMAALAALALGRLWLPDGRRPDGRERAARPRTAPVVPFGQRIRVSLALGVPMVVSVALWMAFFDWIWGSPFPSVVYGTQRPVALGVLRQGRPWPALRPGIRDRPGGADLRGVAGRADRDARGRTPLAPRRRGDRRDLRRAAGPGRRLPPLVRRIGRHRPAGDRGDPAARPADRLAGAPHRASSAVAARVAGAAGRGQRRRRCCSCCRAQQGLLLVAGRDGVSRLLEYWSPTWRLWSLAPSFLMQPPAIAWAFTAIWLIALAAAADGDGPAAAAARAGRRRTGRVRRRRRRGAARVAARPGRAGSLARALARAGRPRADGAALRLRRAAAAARRRLRSAAARALVGDSAAARLRRRARARAASAPASICSTTRAGRCPPAATSSCLDGRGRTAPGRDRPAGRARRSAAADLDDRAGGALDDDASICPANARFVGFRASPELAGAGARSAADPARRRRPADAPDRSGRPAEPAVRRRRGVLLRRAGRAGADRLLDTRRQLQPPRRGARRRSADGAAPARRAGAGDACGPRSTATSSA